MGQGWAAIRLEHGGQLDARSIGVNAKSRHVPEALRFIAFLAGPPAVPASQERLEGYRRALREAEIELDDLVSWGNFGLMDAIRGFEPERNIKFKTYCTTRIRGSILDELRSQRLESDLQLSALV